MGQRIAFMLAMRFDRTGGEAAQLRGTTMIGPAMNTPSRDYGEQTMWMLAVRDQRDKAAFAKLYDHFSPKLLGFVMRSGATKAQAEEVIQDVMLTIWRKADQFDPHRATVSAWLYQITRNRHIDMQRKENRPVPEMLKHEGEAAEDSAQILGLEQETEALQRALDSLKPQQREMIEKAYLGELSHREISEQTGIALGTIKSRIRLGLARLKHELKGLER